MELAIPSASAAPPIVASAAARPSPTSSASRCSAGCIAGTLLDDTDEDRRVVAFVATYQRAVTARDAAALVALASPRYLDDGGTPDPADDVDRGALESFLKATFAKLDRNDVEVRPLAVKHDGDHVVVTCAISGSYAFKAAPDKPQTFAREAVLVLEATPGGLKALKGF